MCDKQSKACSICNKQLKVFSSEARQRITGEKHKYHFKCWKEYMKYGMETAKQFHR